MVASKRLGFFKREITRCTEGAFSSESASSKDFNWREKKATSAPEIRAEQHSKNNTNID